MTHRVGDLCHLLGRTEACRIIGHEIGVGSLHDYPTDWWHVETPEGTLLVEPWQITETWPVEDDLGKYEPPACRFSTLDAEPEESD